MSVQINKKNYYIVTSRIIKYFCQIVKTLLKYMYYKRYTVKYTIIDINYGKNHKINHFLPIHNLTISNYFKFIQ